MTEIVVEYCECGSTTDIHTFQCIMEQRARKLAATMIEEVKEEITDLEFSPVVQRKNA